LVVAAAVQEPHQFWYMVLDIGRIILFSFLILSKFLSTLLAK